MHVKVKKQRAGNFENMIMYANWQIAGFHYRQNDL